MTKNLLLGLAMLVVCVAIQCFVVALLLRVLRAMKARRMLEPTLGRITLLLSAVMLIMVAGNTMQAAMWAGLYMMLGEFNDFATAFYFSVVSFTTLGYGDITMSEEHRVLGAFEAGNGVLMLGLTTSVLFLVLNTAVRKVWHERNEGS